MATLDLSGTTLDFGELADHVNKCPGWRYIPMLDCKRFEVAAIHRLSRCGIIQAPVISAGNESWRTIPITLVWSYPWQIGAFRNGKYGYAYPWYKRYWMMVKWLWMKICDR